MIPGSGHPTQVRRRAGREDGFTLVELLVVLVIFAILLAAAFMGLRSAKSSARARSMSAATATVTQAVSAFNRARPPVSTDPLTSGSTWTSTQTEAAGGLYSITGERLLDPWPTDPYSGAPIVIRRQTVCPPPASVAAGSVVVCRLQSPAGTSRAAFRVIGGARNNDGTNLTVYDKSFG